MLSYRTFASSVYVPAFPFIQADFGVAREKAILPLSMYTLGVGFGPLLAAPLSEVFGRRPIYLSTLPLLMGWTFAAGCAENIEILVICRFLAAFCGSAALAIGAGT